MRTCRKTNYRTLNLFLLLMLIGFLINAIPWTRVSGASSPALPVPPDSFSSLIFGTNLSIYNADDPFLKSPEVRQQLKNIGITTIRTPMRRETPPELELQAVKLIFEMGLTPLVILHNRVTVPTAPQDDKIIVEGVRKIMESLGKPDLAVYYEYGNEPELNGVSKEEYTTAWNLDIPILSQIAGPHAYFIGPVSYDYEEKRDAIQYFIQHAQPEPDMVSWHEYACDSLGKYEGPQSKEECLADVDGWSGHFAEIRAFMRETLGKELPLMITEWNYTPHMSSGQDDGFISDPTFMKEWTTKVLSTLAKNAIFASFQYAAVHTPIPLVTDKGDITSQGKAFQEVAQGISALSTKAPASLAFSFESGSIEGWNGRGGIAGVASSTIQAQNGKHALQVQMDPATAETFPEVYVETAFDVSTLTGPRLTMSVYVESADATDIRARLFVVDSHEQWHTPLASEYVALQANAWNTLTYTLPATEDGVIQIGAMFAVPANSKKTIYIDTVSLGK